MKKILYLILLLNIALICSIWWLGDSGSLWLSSGNGKLIALGRLFGLIAELGVIIQLLLIGRIPIVEKQFGHDGLANVHKINGQVLVLLLLAHPLFLIWGYSNLSESSFISQFYFYIGTN